MFQYATVYMIIALVAAIFGIGAVATGAGEIAELLLLVFVVLFDGGLVAGLRNRGDPQARGELEMLPVSSDIRSNARRR